MAHSMPDIAATKLKEAHAHLDWVGMSHIALPLALADASGPIQCLGRANVFVDLADPHARGIHMSRLYALLDQQSEQPALTPAGLSRLLERFLHSHRDLDTRSARLDFQFELALRRTALRSELSGWQHYPASLHGSLLSGALNIECSVTVPYSSTCPCSAALSRQLLANAFLTAFEDTATCPVEDVARWIEHHGSHATPHSQRSTAWVRVALSNEARHFPFSSLVMQMEDALGTPVQTAVKREDEQAFARLNGENLMFCEDAARRLKARLEQEAAYTDFQLRVEHHESLHAHDAVAFASKHPTPRDNPRWQGRAS